MVRLRDIRRLDLGYFVRPAVETGTGPRVEPVLGYLVPQPAGWLLFDTGMGIGPADLEAHYRPVRRPLADALAHVGIGAGDVSSVANCHLHFDHCGGNPLLAGRPIFTQRVELAQAQTLPDYTLPQLVDFAGATYEEINGETELFRDVWAIPTPGHTPGHQSLVVRCDDGTVVLAGQAHDTATAFGRDAAARQARQDGLPEPLPVVAPWLDRLAEFDPARVLFAHDLSVWEPVTRRFASPPQRR